MLPEKLRDLFFSGLQHSSKLGKKPAESDIRHPVTIYEKVCTLREWIPVRAEDHELHAISKLFSAQPCSEVAPTAVSNEKATEFMLIQKML